jgi:hypothetical protein
MSILSIDIGIKNLSMCILNYEDKNDLSSYKIQLWNVFDTLDTKEYLCEELKKNNTKCGKKCNYTFMLENIERFCCKTHFPKILLPIKKQNQIKKKLVNDYLLQDIAKIVLTKLQEIYNTNFDIFSQIKSIIIELQPKINPKMKFISHIIYGKLTELYLDTNTTIRFVRASQKLKAYKGPALECKLKGAYAKRKWLSIQYTRWIIENTFHLEQKEQWLPFFETHSKKDDMSDTLLMGINAITGIPKKQQTDKKGKCIK